MRTIKQFRNNYVWYTNVLPPKIYEIYRFMKRHSTSNLAKYFKKLSTLSGVWKQKYFVCKFKWEQSWYSYGKNYSPDLCPNYIFNEFPVSDLNYGNLWCWSITSLEHFINCPKRNSLFQINSKQPSKLIGISSIVFLLLL